MLIPLLMVSIFLLAALAAAGPFLKLFGIVDWQWKAILAPILVPLTALILWLLGWALFWGMLIGMLAFIAK
jgi:hypothetical protein